MMESSAAIAESLVEHTESEHIYIGSDSDDAMDDTRTPRVVDAELVQVSEARGFSATYTIFDDRYLQVRRKEARSEELRYQLDLAYLDPKPRHRARVATRWLRAAVGLGACALLAFSVSGAVQTPLLDQPWLPANVLFAAAAIVCFLVFIQRTDATLVFRTVHGKVRVIELDALIPDKHSVAEFACTLCRCIREAAAGSHHPDKALHLREVLRVHHRLFEESAISEADYEEARGRILRCHD